MNTHTGLQTHTYTDAAERLYLTQHMAPVWNFASKHAVGLSVMLLFEGRQIKIECFFLNRCCCPLQSVLLFVLSPLSFLNLFSLHI